MNTTPRNSTSSSPSPIQLQPVPKVKRYWDGARMAQFEDLWLREPEEVVADLMGCSVERCRRVAIERCLRRRDTILSPSIVAAELYVHPNTVLTWCRKGLLPATRSRILRNRMGQVWEVDARSYAIFKEVWLAIPYNKRYIQVAMPEFEKRLGAVAAEVA